MRIDRMGTLAVIGAFGLAAGVGQAHVMSLTQQDQPAAEAPQAVDAVVIELQGSVKSAAVGVDPKDSAAWTDVQKDDRLGADTQIKTGFRSYAILKFGDDTVIQVRKMSLVSIAEFTRSATQQDVRLTLGYGVVRGGSAEGALRSEVVVDSTVATLAKRGTEGWQMAVEPSTGDFQISLTRSGLLAALSKLSGQTKTVAPGEYADTNNIMSMWVNTAVFDRAFKFFSDDSQSSDTEVSFSSQNTSGNAVVTQGGGSGTSDATGQNDPTFVTGLIEDMLPGDEGPPPPPTFLDRSEGDFGVPDTFQGLLGSLQLKRAEGNRSVSAQRSALRQVRKAPSRRR